MGRRRFKIITTSVCFPLRRLRRIVCRSNGNPSLQILEYSTPRPTFITKIRTSNFVGAKFSRWHLGINSFWRLLGSSLEFPRWHLGITSFWSQLGSSLLGIGDYWRFFSGIPLCFSMVGFTMLVRSWGTTYFPVEVLL